MNNPPLEYLILTIRGQKVLLDADLAAIYSVPTKALNQAVKRNAERFPEDFRFPLSKTEAAEAMLSRSQVVTLKRGQNINYLPHAFTDGFQMPASSFALHALLPSVVKIPSARLTVFRRNLME